MESEAFDKNRSCTPSPSLAMVDSYFGAIDLDPCWDPDCIVQASHKFDIRQGQDGLRLSWKIPGVTRVFCNPPFNDWQRWAKKAREECESGELECIQILPISLDVAAWHDEIFDHVAAIAFPRGRVRFLRRGVEMRSPNQDARIAYVLHAKHPRLLDFADSFAGCSIVYPARSIVQIETERDDVIGLLREIGASNLHLTRKSLVHAINLVNQFSKQGISIPGFTSNGRPL